MPEQCDINWMDKWTDLSEEIVQFREAFSNIEMSYPSVSRSAYIDFEDEEMPQK